MGVYSRYGVVRAANFSSSGLPVTGLELNRLGYGKCRVVDIFVSNEYCTYVKLQTTAGNDVLLVSQYAYMSDLPLEKACDGLYYSTPRFGTTHDFHSIGQASQHSAKMMEVIQCLLSQLIGCMSNAHHPSYFLYNNTVL